MVVMIAHTTPTRVAGISRCLEDKGGLHSRPSVVWVWSVAMLALRLNLKRIAPVRFREIWYVNRGWTLMRFVPVGAVVHPGLARAVSW